VRPALDELRSLSSFLFSPQGWIGRANYFRGVAIVALSSWLLGTTTAFYGGHVGLGVLAPLLTLPTMVCITSKRLHGLNLSGWVQAPVRIFSLIALLVLAAAFRGAKPEPMLLNLAAPMAILAMLGDLVLFLWLLAARTRPPETPVAEVFD
jgi:uncharacterized membrane protein YhaH (DUF805 family)